MILSSATIRVEKMKHFTLGNSRVPLGLPGKVIKRDGKLLRLDDFRGSNLGHRDLIKASDYIKHGLKHQADIYDTCEIPSTRKGRTLKVVHGLRTHQITIQPKQERGWITKGVLEANRDWLLFYDMDKLSGLPTPGNPVSRFEDLPFEVAYQKMRVILHDQGRAFVWRNLRGAPKAAFHMVGSKTATECIAFLRSIHEEVFGGDPDCAPAEQLGDMYQSFVPTVDILEAMTDYFAEVEFNHIQHNQRLAEQGRLEELMGEFEKEEKMKSWASPPLDIISGTTQIGLDFENLITTETDAVLAHGFTPKYPDLRFPKSLMGRQYSPIKDLILKFVVSMSYRLLNGDGVAIPCTVIQRELCRLGLSRMSFNGTELDCSTAAKAIKDLVNRGVLGYAEPDETKRYRPHQRATVYVAAHPDLIAIAQKHIDTSRTKTDFKNRTAEQAAARYLELTGKRIEDIEINGCSWTAIRPLTNFCPSLLVFTELCMMIPGFLDKPDRVRKLETLWRKHEKNLRRRKLLEGIESELLEVA